MNASQSDEPDQAAAALIGKVRRLMAVTVGATFLALAVVLVFIGYRVFSAGGSVPASAPVLGAAASLPKGARIVSTAVADGHIVVTIETPEGTEVRRYDANTMKEVGRLRFTTTP